MKRCVFFKVCGVSIFALSSSSRKRPSIFFLPVGSGNSNRHALLKPSINRPLTIHIQCDSWDWKAVAFDYKKLWAPAFRISLPSVEQKKKNHPLIYAKLNSKQKKVWVMANALVFLSDLQRGRSSSTLQVRLLRFWDPRNVGRGGDLMGVDMLLLDSQVSY